MKRTEKDLERIDEILGSWYEKTKGRGAFVVLTEDGGMSALSGGDSCIVLSAVSQYLSEIVANNADSLAEAEDIIKTIAKVMLQNAREEWEAAHGTPDISMETSRPLTEEEMVAMIGRKRPGLGRKE